MSNNTDGKVKDGRPQVIITEQPSSKGLRFRYECEKKYASAIFGVKSSLHKRTFPTIKILNWNGPVRIVLSCVTKDPPYRPHPHNILGKVKEVANGILDFKYESTEMALGFSYLSIQCVKKNDVAKSLALRKKLRVDPFNTGFDHALDPSSIDLYSLRLCIQVFLEGSTPGVFNVPLKPIVTDPINDRRNKSDFEIVYLTHDEASVTGGSEMCILCERTDNDIDVVFYRKKSNWEEIAELKSPGFFKGVAIVIFTPSYVDQDITEPVEVNIQLRKHLTGDVSNSVPFTYLPLHSRDINPLKRKREEDICTCEQLQEVEKNKNQVHLPKNIDSCNAWNLPEHKNKENVDFRQPTRITDLSVSAIVYSNPLAVNSDNVSPKTKNCVNNFRTRKNDDERKTSFTQGSNLESPLPIENANEVKDEPQHHSNYSNTLDSDDWIHELLQTIEEDSMQKKKEPEIVQEPEIKYISPDPMPNITINTIPEVQNYNNCIANNVVYNNHQEIPSFSISHFIEKMPSLPERFATEMNTLANNHERQEPPQVMPFGHHIHYQHPQYALNINGNQWSNTLNNVMNEQPLVPSNYQYVPVQPAHLSQMSVDNNFNGHSRDYMMSNGSYGTQIQPFNQENTWHQVQRSTLNEFDPLYPTQTWRSTQESNSYKQ